MPPKGDNRPDFAWLDSPQFDIRTRKAATRGVPVVQRYNGATLDTQIDGRQFNMRFPTGLDGVQTLANEATPTVKGGGMYQTGGTTTITDFDDGVIGDVLYLEAKHSVTITHGSPIQLNGDANYTMVSGDTLVLAMFDDQVWVEIARGGQAASGSGGGAQCATLVIGPSSNSDSADYDYTTDGTDDDVQIQAAIDALTGGGTILLREGTYTLSDKVLVNEVNVRFVGMGDATIITIPTNFYNGSTIDYMFDVSVADVEFHHIYFDGNKANQTNNGGPFDIGGDNFTMEHCKFVNAKNSAVEHTAAGLTSYFYRCFFSEWEDGYLAIYDGGNSSDFVVDNCFFSTTQTGVSCIGESQQRSIISNNYFYLNSAYNANCIDNARGLVAHNYIVITGAMGSSARAIDTVDARVIGNHIDASGGSANIGADGIFGADIAHDNLLWGLGTGIDGCSSVKNNYILDSRAQAVVVTGSNSVIQGNYISGSGVATSDTYDGILINSAVDRCVITGNRVFGGTMRYAVNVSASTCDNNIVSNNILTDGVSGQLNDAGTGTVTDGSNVTS